MLIISKLAGTNNFSSSWQGHYCLLNTSIRNADMITSTCNAEMDRKVTV